MLRPEDFLPQLPWEGLPIPRFLIGPYMTRIGLPKRVIEVPKPERVPREVPRKVPEREPVKVGLIEDDRL